MKKPSRGPEKLTDLIRDLPRGALIGAVVVVAGIVAAMLTGVIGGGSSPNTNQQAFARTFKPQAEAMAAAVGASLTPYADALEAISTNPDVVAALAANDGVLLAALGASLKPRLDGVLRLRLLPVDVREPDASTRPPLTYASISMLRRAAESSEAPAAEVHLAGGEDEHLAMVRRVEGQDAESDLPVNLGFVHLSIDPDVLRKIVRDGAPPGVFAELKQGVKLRVVAVGTQPHDSAPSIVARVNDTALSIKYTAPGALSAATGSTGMLMYIPLLVFAVLVAGFLFYRSQRPAVRVGAASSDSVIYQGAIKAILEGAHPGLEQLMPGSRSPPTNFDLGITAERAAGDDVTAFTNPDADSPSAIDPDAPGIGDPFDITGGDAAGLGIVVTESAVPPSIFRSYDIRGIVDETLTEEGVYQIGRALGAEAEARGQKTLVVARDGRHSSEPLLEALTKGLLESGRDVIDIGLAPTPVLYFATHYLAAHSGVMITGSHNPAQYNGLKVVLDGETLSGEAIQAIRRRVEEQDYVEGTGSLEHTDIVAEYIRRISEDIPVTLGHALKVVVDCGNGVPGTVAPDILRAIGHDVIELFCDVDGDFPNHHPDPSQPENLQALIEAVAEEGADLGLAFDGDGDRLGVVDSEGNVIWPDRQMILFARDILSRNPGAKIIYDVKCSRHLPAEITASGGEPIMYKTGHSLIKSKMQECGALLAGEMSGHIFFKERWYGFDDALYSAARLLEILVNSGQTPAEVFAALPGGVVTPELRLDMVEEEHAGFMAKVLAATSFDDAQISTIDGLRVDFADSWGLIRPSNTTPCLVLRFEGDDQAALERVQERFRGLLSGIDADLALPF